MHLSRFLPSRWLLRQEEKWKVKGAGETKRSCGFLSPGLNLLLADSQEFQDG